MKIVIDTNVYVSALYSSRGISNKFLQRLFYKYIENNKKYNIISVPLLFEIEDVLKRENRLTIFQTNKYKVDDFINAIVKISYKMDVIHYLWRPFLKDVKDDMVLETAFNGKAKFIITYNLKHFRNVEKFFNIKPIRPVEFLEKIGG